MEIDLQRYKYQAGGHRPIFSDADGTHVYKAYDAKEAAIAAYIRENCPVFAEWIADFKGDLVVSKEVVIDAMDSVELSHSSGMSKQLQLPSEEQYERLTRLFPDFSCGQLSSRLNFPR